jgi:hypothetical protein
VVRDMALTLVAEKFGPAAAHTAHLLIEYDPQPPFGAGNPNKAPQPIVNAARDQFRKLSR